MRLLVIGSNSFSGSHFVKEALKHNHIVFGVSRSEEPETLFLPYRWPNEKLESRNLKNFKFKSLDINKDLDKLINCDYIETLNYHSQCQFPFDIGESRMIVILHFLTRKRYQTNAQGVAESPLRYQ